MTLENIEACGGDYVELMEVGNSGNASSDRKYKDGGKENLFNPSTTRASSYRNKLHPTHNLYRTSEYDQMPVRVFPLPNIKENTIPQPCGKTTSSRRKMNYKTTPRKVKWGEVHVKSLKETTLTPKNRATSCDNLLITSQRRYVTRSTLKSLNENVNLNESNFSISSNEEKNTELSQTLMRNKLRSSKTRRYRQRLNSIFTKNTKSKCKSEFALNQVEEFEVSKKKKNVPEIEMQFCNEDSSINKSTFSRKRRLSSIRSKIHKRFGKEEKNTDMKQPTASSSPMKRKAEVICNEMCDDSDAANNNQPMTLRDVLNDKGLCEEFRQFLSNEHSDENLDFWMICERFRTTTNDRINLAEIIFRQFLGSGAPREVNIDAKTRSTLDQNLRNLDYSSFISAQDCIYKLMEEDSFRRFCWMRKTKKPKF